MPEVKEFERLGLLSVANGAAPELFAEELQRCLDNIADVNTSDTQKRVITLKCTITPDPDKETLFLTIEAQSKLAAVKAASGMAYIGRTKGGKVSAVAHMARQPDLPFGEDEDDGLRRMDEAREKAAAGE